MVCPIINDNYCRITLFVNKMRRHHPNHCSEREDAEQSIMCFEKVSDKLCALLRKPIDIICSIAMLCWYIYLRFGHVLLYLTCYFYSVSCDGYTSDFCNHAAVLAENQREEIIFLPTSK